MEGVDPQTSELYIARLKTILGDEWCADQLAKYKEFRDQYSPSDLWSHKLPTISPIVPLLFQHEYDNQRKIQPHPLGYWYGDPVHYLRHLATSIFMFEDFWSKLPGHNGSSNIRFKLSEPGQFNGFVFELLVAVDSKLSKYKEYDIEPRFFDPTPIKGGPDIVLRKGTQQIAIQCKTRSPSSATNMPFDLFQYLFGRFYRIVQDSGYSYKLSLNLKRKLAINDIEELLRLLNSAVMVGLEIPSHSVNSNYDIRLSKLNVPISGLSLSEVKGLLERDSANLCTEIGAFNPFGKKATAFNRIAICSVSTINYKSPEEYFVDSVAEAAQEAHVSTPLVLAIHFYGSVDLERYIRNSTDANRLRRRLDNILRKYPRIKYVYLSSDKQKYSDLADGARITYTQHMTIHNNYFAGQS